MIMEYGGIGARNSSLETLARMTEIAQWLVYIGLTLRSGRAKGADQAFERGSLGKSKIFLPWSEYQKSANLIANMEYPSPAPLAYEIARTYHPAWERCGPEARDLHARNSHIVLDWDLETPVDFIVCSTDGKGGTAQSLRIAQAYDIKIFNLAIERHHEELLEYVKERYT